MENLQKFLILIIVIALFVVGGVYVFKKVNKGNEISSSDFVKNFTSKNPKTSLISECSFNGVKYFTAQIATEYFIADAPTPLYSSDMKIIQGCGGFMPPEIYKEQRKGICGSLNSCKVIYKI